jgi:hypothetical protein
VAFYSCPRPDQTVPDCEKTEQGHTPMLINYPEENGCQAYNEPDNCQQGSNYTVGWRRLIIIHLSLGSGRLMFDFILKFP